LSALKKAKNGQMAKPFYFWQTVSKRPNWADLAFKKAKWQPCHVLFEWPQCTILTDSTIKYSHRSINFHQQLCMGHLITEHIVLLINFVDTFF